jgi:hypothetical protein
MGGEITFDKIRTYGEKSGSVPNFAPNPGKFWSVVGANAIIASRCPILRQL